MNLRPLLVRCYPARWRARYGDEFETILDERPLGPFDVADILLGAFDAQLRLRNVGAAITTGRGFSMSLRIGGFAAIIGGALMTTGILLGTGIAWEVEPEVSGILFLSGFVALLVAVTSLSAFQARTHPVFSWAAFAVIAVGVLISAIGIVGMQLFEDGYWDVMVVGVLGVLVGSTLFAMATYRTAALSRGAAMTLGVASVLMIPAGFSGNTFGPVPAIVVGIGIALGWFVLGINAIRLDRPAAQPRPA
jgi:hypothetical protein